nr:MAG TPA: major capsid protein [Caudoviricetes sp.]
MARTDARSIYDSSDDTTKAKLAELSGKLIEGIFATAISSGIKNVDYSGDPTTGSVEVNRFKNAVSKDYGSARTAGKGEALRNTGKVTVNINQRKEIIEEVNGTDLALFGLAGLAEKRANNHLKQMVAVLDRAFFAEAEAKATNVVLTGITAVEDVAEKMIQTIISVKNDWVDGVDKDDVVMTLNPKTYGKLRNYFDKVTVPTVNSGTREINMFHGVETIENLRQTADVLIQVKGAMALPVLVNQYDAEKIPLSNDYALELFYDYGIAVLAKDLIFKGTLA